MANLWEVADDGVESAQQSEVHADPFTQVLERLKGILPKPPSIPSAPPDAPPTPPGLDIGKTMGDVAGGILGAVTSPIQVAGTSPWERTKAVSESNIPELAKIPMYGLAASADVLGNLMGPQRELWSDQISRLGQLGISGATEALGQRRQQIGESPTRALGLDFTAHGPAEPPSLDKIQQNPVLQDVIKGFMDIVAGKPPTRQQVEQTAGASLRNLPELAGALKVGSNVLGDLPAAVIPSATLAAGAISPAAANLLGPQRTDEAASQLAGVGQKLATDVSTAYTYGLEHPESAGQELAFLGEQGAWMGLPWGKVAELAVKPAVMGAKLFKPETGLLADTPVLGDVASFFSPGMGRHSRAMQEGANAVFGVNQVVGAPGVAPEAKIAEFLTNPLAEDATAEMRAFYKAVHEPLDINKTTLTLLKNSIKPEKGMKVSQGEIDLAKGFFSDVAPADLTDDTIREFASRAGWSEKLGEKDISAIRDWAEAHSSTSADRFIEFANDADLQAIYDRVSKRAYGQASEALGLNQPTFLETNFPAVARFWERRVAPVKNLLIESVLFSTSFPIHIFEETLFRSASEIGPAVLKYIGQNPEAALKLYGDITPPSVFRLSGGMGTHVRSGISIPGDIVKGKAGQMIEAAGNTLLQAPAKYVNWAHTVSRPLVMGTFIEKYAQQLPVKMAQAGEAVKGAWTALSDAVNTVTEGAIKRGLDPNIAQEVNYRMAAALGGKNTGVFREAVSDLLDGSYKKGALANAIKGQEGVPPTIRQRAFDTLMRDGVTPETLARVTEDGAQQIEQQFRRMFDDISHKMNVNALQNVDMSSARSVIQGLENITSVIGSESTSFREMSKALWSQLAKRSSRVVAREHQGFVQDWEKRWNLVYALARDARADLLTEASKLNGRPVPTRLLDAYKALDEAASKRYNEYFDMADKFWNDFRAGKAETSPLDWRESTVNPFFEESDKILDAARADVLREQQAWAGKMPKKAAPKVTEKKTIPMVEESAEEVPPDLDAISNGAYAQLEQDIKESQDAFRQSMEKAKDAYAPPPIGDAAQRNLIMDIVNSATDANARLAPQTVEDIMKIKRATAASVGEDMNGLFYDPARTSEFDELMKKVFPFWMYESRAPLTWFGRIFAKKPYLMHWIFGDPDSELPPGYPARAAGKIPLENLGLQGWMLDPYRSLAFNRFLKMSRRAIPMPDFDKDPFAAGFQVLTGELDLWPDPAIELAMTLLGKLPEDTIVPSAGKLIMGLLGKVPGGKYGEYLVRQELASKGIDPDAPTPEQRSEAEAAAGHNVAIEQAAPRLYWVPAAEIENNISIRNDVARITGRSLETLNKPGDVTLAIRQMTSDERNELYKNNPQAANWAKVTWPLYMSDEQIAKSTDVDRFWKFVDSQKKETETRISQVMKDPKLSVYEKNGQIRRIMGELSAAEKAYRQEHGITESDTAPTSEYTLPVDRALRDLKKTYSDPVPFRKGLSTNRGAQADFMINMKANLKPDTEENQKKLAEINEQGRWLQAETHAKLAHADATIREGLLGALDKKLNALSQDAKQYMTQAAFQAFLDRDKDPERKRIEDENQAFQAWKGMPTKTDAEKLARARAWTANPIFERDFADQKPGNIDAILQKDRLGVQATATANQFLGLVDPKMVQSTKYDQNSFTMPKLEGAMEQWQTLIDKYARAYGVDPAVVAATMKVESGGNPRASGDGGHSIGLMQINKVHGLGDTRYDPETNIKKGVELLAGGYKTRYSPVDAYLAFNPGADTYNGGAPLRAFLEAYDAYNETRGGKPREYELAAKTAKTDIKKGFDQIRQQDQAVSSKLKGPGLQQFMAQNAAKWNLIAKIEAGLGISGSEIPKGAVPFDIRKEVGKSSLQIQEDIKNYEAAAERLQSLSGMPRPTRAVTSALKIPQFSIPKFELDAGPDVVSHLQKSFANPSYTIPASVAPKLQTLRVTNPLPGATDTQKYLDLLQREYAIDAAQPWLNVSKPVRRQSRIKLGPPPRIQL